MSNNSVNENESNSLSGELNFEDLELLADSQAETVVGGRKKGRKKRRNRGGRRTVNNNDNKNVFDINISNDINLANDIMDEVFNSN